MVKSQIFKLHFSLFIDIVSTLYIFMIMSLLLAWEIDLLISSIHNMLQGSVLIFSTQVVGIAYKDILTHLLNQKDIFLVIQAKSPFRVIKQSVKSAL